MVWIKRLILGVMREEGRKKTERKEMWIYYAICKQKINIYRSRSRSLAEGYGEYVQVKLGGRVSFRILKKGFATPNPTNVSLIS